MKTARDRPKILLSEGSSLSARQTLTILGSSGYFVGVCDPNPQCVCRFSRFAKRYYCCPPFNDQPLDYVRFVADVAQRDGYRVLIPVHEQAYLLAKYNDLVSTPMALADFSAFEKVQGKVAFAQVLQGLSLPQPGFKVVENPRQLKDCAEFPFYLKTNFGTAGQGVWRIEDATQRDQVIAKMLSEDGATEKQLLIQKPADGRLCQVQAIFNRGQLWASHCTQTRGASIGGGHAARMSVHHPVVFRHVGVLGHELGWHGPISLDYIYDESAAQPYYLEANPRLVEPMNAYLSGIDFPELVIRAALGTGRPMEQPLLGKPGVRSHSLMANQLGLASDGASRRDLIRTIIQAIKNQGIFEDSQEDLMPFALDPASTVPFLVVLAQLLINPRRANMLGKKTIDSYSLRANTIAGLQETPIP